MKTNKEMIAVMQAFESGAKVEFTRSKSGTWNDAATPVWDWNNYDYRVKPSPKLRAWKPEEVPVGALIRHKDYKIGRTVILYVCGDLIKDATPAGKGSSEYTAERALNLFEHSTDCGKTWLPCGVLEVSK